jgi:CRISPR-associated protein Cas2
MLVLVTYDVNTQTSAGKTRLRKVARQCVNYGQRVQSSVFECSLDAAQYTKFKNILLKLIDTGKDSLRFYNLGDNYHNRIEHFGSAPGYNAEGTLIV